MTQENLKLISKAPFQALPAYSKWISRACWIPFAVLGLGILVFFLSMVASAFQELLPKWVAAHDYLPKAMAYLLLGAHVLLTSGLAFLVFILFFIKNKQPRHGFYVGMFFLLYFPLRVFFIFMVMPLFPLWLALECGEIWVLKKIYRKFPQRPAPP
ncbi:hypothetical protein AVHY2522_03420 [Acidovorax sp. SUPP2522]|uniref:hypothetical protein n=1 Tax=unclassified Acidovorax TaxID=2684926 RepID=UPI00234AD116|nr:MULTISPECIES: hypothetical protein [unclassified Acidovorax]WCM98408.1 hypothetical protein M5C96_02805 [Acidovorax sp. GBBC 1281]GKT14109.1 hypothetical protein AVHY2522_03420 [Acidovorax sp. SUPP2522]